MSIATRIQAMEEHISDAYDSLNKLGVTANNKNIENIAGLIDEIYDSSPKTDYASGTDLTLENTRVGKIDFKDTDNIEKIGFGATSQQTYTGKNLLENILTQSTNEGITFTSNSDGSVTANGTATGTALAWVNSNFTLPAGTYTLSGCPNDGSDSTYRLDINSSAYIDTGNGVTFTLSSETTIRNVRIRIASGYTANKIVFKPMIEKASAKTTYEPYTGGIAAPNPEYPQEIEVVRGNIETRIRGANNFDISQVEIGKAWNNTSVSNRAICYFDVEEGDIFTVSATGISGFDSSIVRCIFKVNKESTTNLGTYEISSSRTLTAPTGTGIACIQFNKENISLSDFEGVEIMINEGDTALPYEPYQTPQTYQLLLGEYEFARIGNYVDTIEYDVDNDKVYKNENVGKYKLPQIVEAIRTGTILDTPNTHYTIIRYLQNAIDIVPSTEISYNWYCNKLHRANGTASDYGAYIVSGSGNTNMVIIVNSNDTLESLNTKLNNNIFYYQKATTTRTEITGTLKDQIKALYNSQSLNGTTIIEIDGQLPLILKVRALKG